MTNLDPGAASRGASAAQQYATTEGVLDRLTEGTRKDLRKLGPFELWCISVDGLCGNIGQLPLQKQRDFLAMLAVAAIVRLAQCEGQP